MSVRSRGVTGRDGALLAALAAAAAALHWRVLFGGQTYFHNDLIHVIQPWATLSAEQLQRGQMPLWNPYSYFGMPLLGTMQTQQFHPFAILYHSFYFERAVGLYLLASYVMGSLGAYLWLRRWGFRRWACATAAAVVSLGGYSMGFVHNTNLLNAVMHLPGFLLFWGSVPLLAVHSALTFLAGYPPFWGVAAAMAFLVRGLWPSRGGLRGGLSSAAGLALGLLISAAVLLPGAELAWNSNRRGGLSLSERLNNSFQPGHLSAFVHPELTRWLSRRGRRPEPQAEEITWTRPDGTRKTFRFYMEHRDPVRDPTGSKYVALKSCYFGFAGSALAATGLLLLARRAPLTAAGTALSLAAVALLLLGSSTGWSYRLWQTLTVLHYYRGPGRLTFLPLGLVLPLIAAAVHAASLRTRGLAGAAALALVAAELLWTGRGYHPTAPFGYFHQTGALTDFLRARLGPQRYFQAVSQEVWAYVDKDDPSPDYQDFKRMVFDTYRQKLFGVSNAAYHFHAGSGDYESLHPRRSRDVMEFLKNADRRKLADYLRIAGVKLWLDRAPLPDKTLADAGQHLWRAYEVPGEVSRAYWMPARAADALARPFADAPGAIAALPWSFERPREDRLRIRGTAPEPGLLYVAEPDYPGWQAYVNGRRAALKRAWEAFVAMEVPQGPVEAVLLYRPLSWRLGLLVSLLSLGGLALSAARRIKEGP